ncbi:vWA domain-containing protein [Ilumatobacter coccineus]|uniref:Putative carbon monoxide dehydrogenase accessory protein n=1 Tax=Ilumatobacter coccineus (strain NBRC 103263 / KCTC 29153 / YM16-304) TaxID=1313172 RepID=A0A6C7EAZ5_ILUCY|nr:VWA domain-containing protein [Ilumatobacter coccineus]BAN03651.1 putative carbon monoxide dehydrogenase accessory protein [Ilumatobacter coccineus YM16-304]
MTSTAPPDSVMHRSDPARIAVAFTRVLRGAGMKVPTSCTHTFADALCELGLDDRSNTYWAGRATLARRPEDIEIFDRAFAVFFDGRTAPLDLVDDEPLSITIAVDTDDDDDDDGAESGEANDDPTIELRFSSTEVLRHKDFAQYSDDELQHAHDLMSQLRLVGSPRSSLRLEPSKRMTPKPDIRRTMQTAIRSGGEPIERHFRRPSTRLRRLVLLLDVSGSMEPYARALLRFVHAAVAGRQKVEAFALGTRLTRITRELGSRDPDVALSAASERVTDWSGGTRLGDGLREFNDQWGVRGLARNSIVVILSDGWDRGDPDELSEQMERMHRVTHRLVWVNPLKVTPGYAPLARGMAAALPHVDHFVEGHSIAAMEELTRVIGQ